MASIPERFVFGRTFYEYENSKIDSGLPIDSTFGTKIPYSQQGDRAMYSPENLKKREDFRAHPLIRNEIEKLWSAVPKDKEEKVCRFEYMAFFLRICKVLKPGITYEVALQMIGDDFLRDAKGVEALDHDMFFQALFELTDIWVPDLSSLDYARFLRSLHERLAIKYVSLSTTRDSTINSQAE